ncbi:hypothetical protein L198_02575 [Cryptococcus wingfieldii CBS 7118]|uniref:Uncharacterized protein n=1 Tax=Cryptococcus wingfieldii CBS 7118 TaxID=1295528 RepID=A0A1E3JLW7_9TREE|nr:hypothetical protein L198_02575 [Cryptococcus wingfieldii CBS 7118]ODO01848.1 hypothetical protein L198_02575 [Cryptococcus wingfieldii CBS 7118]
MPAAYVGTEHLINDTSVDGGPIDDIDTKSVEKDTYGSDLEKQLDSDEEINVRYLSTDHPEGKELTPNEAFTWAVYGDQSPFPEVAACVPNTDDPNMACNTVRALSGGYLP